MLKILKLLFYTLLFVLMLLFYFLYTSYGQKNTYSILSFVASQKTDLDVDVQSVHIRQFPFVRVTFLLEKKYLVEMQGFIKKNTFDFDYVLRPNSLENDVYNLDEKVAIKGKVQGTLDNFKVSGIGQILDGDIHYVCSKVDETYKDVNISLKNINSEKLASLLGEKAFFKGKANSQIYFKYITETSKSGQIRYDVNESKFDGFTANLHIDVAIEDKQHNFLLDLTSPEVQLHLTEGNYNQEDKSLQGFYTIDINDLSKLKPLLKGDYNGSFSTTGDLRYSHGFMIEGASQSLGGLLEYSYIKDSLAVQLHSIPLKNVLSYTNNVPFADANITGQLDYNLSKKKMKLRTKLNNFTFLSTQMIEKLSKRLEANLTKQTFDNSYFNTIYNNGIFTSNLEIANEDMHLFMHKTKVNSIQKSIDTTIDVILPKHSLQGKLKAKFYTNQSTHALEDSDIVFNGTVDKYYKLKLKGLINEKSINMDYWLDTDRFKSHICTIEDKVSVLGHIRGSFSRLRLKVEGQALNGTMHINATRIGELLEDVTLDLKDIHALKLATLLGHPDLPGGKVDVTGHLDIFSKEKREGEITLALRNSKLYALPFSFSSKIKINQDKYTFSADAHLSNANISLSKGEYALATNKVQSGYTLDISDLRSFEPILGYAYHGPFYARGELSYDKTLITRGLSKTFGGFLSYKYSDEILTTILEDVSLKRFMSLMPYPLLLDAKTFGSIAYNFENKKMAVKTQLKKAKFLPSTIVHKVRRKANIDLSKEIFDRCTISAIYQNDILEGDLKLANAQGYVFLTNATLNAKQDTIHAAFDFHLQEQAYTGKIHGLLSQPKVHLNMQKLIKYQMDKQFDSIMGKGNRKMMDSMPMSGMAKDMGAGVAAPFVNIFF